MNHELLDCISLRWICGENKFTADSAAGAVHIAVTRDEIYIWVKKEIAFAAAVERETGRQKEGERERERRMKEATDIHLIHNGNNNNTSSTRVKKTLPAHVTFTVTKI